MRAAAATELFFGIAGLYCIRLYGRLRESST
jgi:hypothetical protein